MAARDHEDSQGGERVRDLKTWSRSRLYIEAGKNYWGWWVVVVVIQAVIIVIRPFFSCCRVEDELEGNETSVFIWRL